MSVLPQCRLLVESEPGSGAWNMAVDALLLEDALHREATSLRWYRWREPTLSVGYFQPLSDAAVPSALAHLPRVQRLSGGGAIVHDVELTYSLALAPEHPLAGEPRALYERVHERIVRTLADFGIVCGLRGESFSHKSGEFLCFSRGDSFDVVMQGYKVLGSAQRRRKGAVLQHGSLVLRRSAVAPQFPGILDLAELPNEPGELVSRLSIDLAGLLGTEVLPQALSEEERRRVDQVAGFDSDYKTVSN